ncbi:MAG: hypothetical protein ACI92I_000911 [Acidimicrobiales bacterium]|jgi:hypothetical protein
MMMWKNMCAVAALALVGITAVASAEEFTSILCLSQDGQEEPVTMLRLMKLLENENNSESFQQEVALLESRGECVKNYKFVIEDEFSVKDLPHYTKTFFGQIGILSIDTQKGKTGYVFIPEFSDETWEKFRNEATKVDT